MVPEFSVNRLHHICVLTFSKNHRQNMYRRNYINADDNLFKCNNTHEQNIKNAKP
jgi:hypothetical protein